MYMRVYIYTYTYIHIHTYISIYMYVCIYICNVPEDYVIKNRVCVVTRI